MSASALKAWCRANRAAKTARSSARAISLGELIEQGEATRAGMDEWREIDYTQAEPGDGWVGTFKNDAFPNLTMRQWSDGSFEMRDGDEITTPRSRT